MRLERGRRYRVVVLATVLAVVLAACGNGRGDDDDSSSANGSSTSAGGARAAASTSTPRLHDRPEHRDAQRRHDQDRDEPAAVGHLRARSPRS